MYVCIYVCMYVCMYVRTYVRMYVVVGVFVYIHYIYIYTYTQQLCMLLTYTLNLKASSPKPRGHRKPPNPTALHRNKLEIPDKQHPCPPKAPKTEALKGDTTRPQALNARAKGFMEAPYSCQNPGARHHQKSEARRTSLTSWTPRAIGCRLPDLGRRETKGGVLSMVSGFLGVELPDKV